VTFDAKGRLFVGMGPQYRNPKPDTPGNSVAIVEDTDGDVHITEGFSQLVIETKDEKVHTGVLIEESGLSVTLGLSTAQRLVIP
jgi:hypothetical protein